MRVLTNEFISFVARLINSEGRRLGVTMKFLYEKCVAKLACFEYLLEES